MVDVSSLDVILHKRPTEARPGRRHVYAYTVTSRDGCEVYLDNSFEPACELARELLSRGVTGKARVIDAETGLHRYTVNIEKAAAMTVEDGRTYGPRFVKDREVETVDVSSERDAA